MSRWIHHQINQGENKTGPWFWNNSFRISAKKKGNNNWEKTVWTQSIQSYETTFQQDLDGDGTTGLNISNLTTASGDNSGWLFKKDYIQK